MIETTTNLKDLAFQIAKRLGWIVIPAYLADDGKWKPAVPYIHLVDTPWTPELHNEVWKRHGSRAKGMGAVWPRDIVAVEADDKEGSTVGFDWMAANGFLDIDTPTFTSRRGPHVLFQGAGDGLDPRPSAGVEVLSYPSHKFMTLPPTVPKEWVPGMSPFDIEFAPVPSSLPQGPAQTTREPFRIDKSFVFENGSRNEQMTRYVGSLFAKGLSESEVLEIADSVNETHSDEPLPDKELESIVTSIGRRESTKVKDSPPATDEVVEDDDDGYKLTPIDVEGLIRDGLPEFEYVFEPYLPRGARVTVVGASGSAKSMWLMYVAAELTRRGEVVVFVSTENPLPVDLRRWGRLRPDFSKLKFFHVTDFDLANPEHVAELRRWCEGASLIAFDPLSGVWSGEEDSNDAVRNLDKHALHPLVKDTNAVLVMVDHTGHAGMNGPRKGIGAGRGASSKGQKVDVELVFASAGSPGTFTIEHRKSTRFGNAQPIRTFVVDDTDDGALVVHEDTEAANRDMLRIQDVAVMVLRDVGRQMSKTELRDAVKARASVGVTKVTDAMNAMADDRRVNVWTGRADAKDGKGRKATWWGLADQDGLDDFRS